MEILGRIIRFLFWVVVLSWAISLLKRVLGFSGTQQKQGEPESTAAESATHSVQSSKKLVRDPICGIHVAEELALTERAGTEAVHFCSASCRDRYLAETHKLAANA